ncbi:MAG: hypothetical protein JXR50_00135 [Prolixibacteraceae bacterium]|nr:hypothetical protein [Prolixibacteraceae bacterium]MBN2648129.1 hypothetical protein [Prolixibacteraceae bacterium]
MKKYIRNIVFLVAGIIFYILWNIGGQAVYGRIVAFGVDKFTSGISKIESVEMKHYEEENKTILYFTYPDRRNNISLEYCLPIVLLLAWHLALFFDKRLSTKKALRYFGINFSIIYLLQILFPLLLFNISQSKVKSMGLFIGLQIFGFLVFFLIIKDSLLLKFNTPEKSVNNQVAETVTKQNKLKK